MQTRTEIEDGLWTEKFKNHSLRKKGVRISDRSSSVGLGEEKIRLGQWTEYEVSIVQG